MLITTLFELAYSGGYQWVTARVYRFRMSLLHYRAYVPARKSWLQIDLKASKGESPKVDPANMHNSYNNRLGDTIIINIIKS